MSKPIIQGWCPGALRPMQSGDGLVVRVRTHLGRIAPDQARALADLARRFGNGLLDVTNRANLQLRGVTPETHPPLIAALREMGLIDHDAKAEARRNVMLSPFAKVGGPEWQAAEDISRLMTAPDAPNVPGKFGFAVDGPACELEGGNADILLRLTGGFSVHLAGLSDVIPLPDAGPAEAARAAVDLARWFIASGGVTNGRGRMKDHIARGALPDYPFDRPERDWTPRQVQVGPAKNGALIGLPFGQVTPDLLARLADLGSLRLTPWRMLLVEGLDRPPALPGLIADASDPLMRVNACTGAPGCPQALADVRSAARALAPRLGPDQTLHVSGCAKGCAHRGPADLTLIATDAQRFNLIRQGTVNDPVTQHRLTLTEIPL